MPQCGLVRVLWRLALQAVQVSKLRRDLRPAEALAVGNKSYVIGIDRW